MTIYEAIKTRISVRKAVQYYGIDVNRHGMVKCPFHDDHRPSMYVDDSHFYCYGCNAHGDLVQFISQLWHIRPYEAARRIAADFGLDDDLPTTEPVKRPRQKPVAPEEVCFQTLMERRKLLKLWYREYAPTVPGQVYHPKFLQACKELSQIEYYLDSLLSSYGPERQNTVAMLMEKIGDTHES